MLDVNELTGLGVAVGAGLLVGLERERRKEERGGDAGLRSFAVAGLSGALAQQSTVLLAVGALFIAMLAGLAYWRNRSEDPGMTTELALFAIYLIGVQAVTRPALAAACATGLALLLAAREGLHRFATQWLSEQELHDGLLLAALTLIALPLIPSGPIALLGGISARPLAGLVLLIMALQAGGQVAMRRLGAGAGLLASALCSGFVSSTATIASLGSRARAEPAQAALLARGGAMSTVATWLQALLMCMLLAPAALPALAPAVLLGAGSAAVLALLGRGHETLPAVAEKGSALRPREALLVALFLAGVTWAVAQAQGQFGASGLLIGVALSAVADAHAPVASLAALHAAGQVNSALLVKGVLLAVGANSLTRMVVAGVSGGLAYARRIAGVLVASWLLAAGLAFLWH